MTKFRPCIDLHEGKVKQVVGGSFSAGSEKVEENFVSDRSAGYFAGLFRDDALKGGHMIMLGAGNEAAAYEALAAYPDGLQVGGGITEKNALLYLEAGASAVIVTSFLFDSDGCFLRDRLEALVRLVGKERLVLDLSCRSDGDAWVVAMDRWRKRTELELSTEVLEDLAGSCAEFLVHAADVEGKCEGIDARLVEWLGVASPIPVTYAGGARSMEDLGQVSKLSRGKVDLTIGSALDIFGGSGARYADCVAFNRSA